MTVYLTTENVLLISRNATGRPAELRDYGLFESALARPAASMFGQDAYPTILTKAAALIHSLTRNHPFIDGNKRTAWLSMTVFCDLNGVVIDTNDDDAEVFVLAVATGELEEVEAIAKVLASFVAE